VRNHDRFADFDGVHWQAPVWCRKVQAFQIAGIPEAFGCPAFNQVSAAA
jgi:hypothetical protein